MKKEELDLAVAAAKKQTGDALQTVYDSLNQGQKKNLLKEPEVAQLLQRYEVKV